MSDDPLLDKTEDDKGSFVEITVKAGMYQSHVATVRKPTLAEVEAEMPGVIKAVVGAQASLERAVNEAKAQAEPAKPGNYGKPSGANTPASDSSLPFADSTTSSTESKVPSCTHGTRKASLYQGKTYYACASDLPKGDPGRCEVVVGS